MEGTDFTLFRESPKNGRPLEEYFLTLDMAKEISMVERNEKGKQARRYFIECERIAKEAAQGTTTLTEKDILAQAMQIIGNENLALSKQIEVLAPKAEFADAISDAEGGVSVNRFSKILTQRGKDWNAPKQKYVEKGWFRVIEYLTDEDDSIQCITTGFVITGKGQQALLGHFLDKYGLRRQLSLFESARSGRTNNPSIFKRGRLQ